jgi:hypothetical protein
MNLATPHLNLLAAWLGVTLGVLSGLALGLSFHREDWLGGYGSFARRMYRLAHISLFGLAILNLLFFFTATYLANAGLVTTVASWAFVIGAASMPVCCVLKLRLPASRMLFTVPVLSLLTGAGLTLWEVIKL